MLNFTFKNPTKILFGSGQIAALSSEVPKKARLMLTYGGGSIKKNGVYNQVLEALKPWKPLEFGGIEPNPTYENLMKAVKIAQKEGVDYLLAVGGGSVIDGTKFIAAAARFPEGQDPWTILSEGAKVKAALPFGSVLTLPATGSEMNMGAVITRAATSEKRAFLSPLVYPQFSILDPETTYSLPARQIGNGIVDAFVHVLEQYLTLPANAKVQDRFAEGLLLTLIEDGPRAIKEPKNYDVRANLMWAATMALNGLIGAGVPQDWSTHVIGHELTAEYGLDHGQTLAVVLPGTLRVRSKEKATKLLQYAERVWGLTSGSDSKRIEECINKTESFFESVGVKTRLSSYGIDNEAPKRIVGRMKLAGLTGLGEEQTVTPSMAGLILESQI